MSKIPGQLQTGRRGKVATGYKGPTPWRARYRKPDDQQRSRTFAKKVDAERFLTSVEHQRMTGAFVDPLAGRVTFQTFAEQWRSVQVHRPGTASQVESNIGTHVHPVLGARPLASIRPSHVQALVKRLATKLAPSTVETIYRHVAAVFKAAARDRMISSSPCEGISLPKSERDHKIVPLEADHVSAAVEMPERWRAAVWVAAGTGLRQGEVLGLTIDRVDFLRRTVKVDRQMVTPAGKGDPAFGPPKTKASYRTVPLPDAVAIELAEHLRRLPVSANGLLFTAADGRPVRRQRMADAWRAAANAAGLPAERSNGFHALRHFYASVLIRFGASVKVVQHRLGHASAVETLDTYSHLWPDDEERTRQAVDDVLAGRDTDVAATARA